MHLGGGIIGNLGLVQKGPNSTDLINEFLERSSPENKGKAILIFGHYHPSDWSKARILSQENENGAKPLINLLTAPYIDYQVIYSPEVSIDPDGAVSIPSIAEATILDKQRISNLKRLANDDGTIPGNR